MFANVLPVFDQAVTQKLLEMPTQALQLGYSVHDVSGKVEAVDLVHYRHVKRSRRGPLFFITAHVQVVVIVTAIG